MVQKHVNLVDFGESFPTNILLQNLALMQKRTSLINFKHLAEKSELGSISNLSTKDRDAADEQARLLHAKIYEREAEALRPKRSVVLEPWLGPRGEWSS